MRSLVAAIGLASALACNPTTPAKVDVLVDRAQVLPAALAMIAGAQREVLVAAPVGGADALLDALAQKKQAAAASEC